MSNDGVWYVLPRILAKDDSPRDKFALVGRGAIELGNIYFKDGRIVMEVRVNRSKIVTCEGIGGSHD